MTLKGTEEARRPLLYAIDKPAKKPTGGCAIPKGWVKRYVKEHDCWLYAPDRETLKQRVAQAKAKPRIEPAKLRPSQVKSMTGAVSENPADPVDYQKLLVLLTETTSLVQIYRETGVHDSSLSNYRLGKRTPDRGNAYALRQYARKRLTAEQREACGL